MSAATSLEDNTKGKVNLFTMFTFKPEKYFCLPFLNAIKYLNENTKQNIMSRVSWHKMSFVIEYLNVAYSKWIRTQLFLNHNYHQKISERWLNYVNQREKILAGEGLLHPLWGDYCLQVQKNYILSCYCYYK